MRHLIKALLSRARLHNDKQDVEDPPDRNRPVVQASLRATGRGAGVLFGFFDGSVTTDRDQHCRYLLRRGCGEGKPDQSIQVAVGRNRQPGRGGHAGGCELAAKWTDGRCHRHHSVAHRCAGCRQPAQGCDEHDLECRRAKGIHFIASIAILTVLFAMLFKWFPDTEIAWRDVLPGALVTALLFNLGKFAIGWYIGTQGLESTYGAAASIVILLIWVYYSAQIVLFGAELTHAYATEAGSLRVIDVNAELPHKAPA